MLCQDAFSLIKLANFAFLCFSEFGFINMDPNKNDFPMMFIMVGNMFCIAEDFAYMCVLFEFGSFNHLFELFNLE